MFLFIYWLFPYVPYMIKFALQHDLYIYIYLYLYLYLYLYGHIMCTQYLQQRQVTTIYTRMHYCTTTLLVQCIHAQNLHPFIHPSTQTNAQTCRHTDRQDKTKEDKTRPDQTDQQTHIQTCHRREREKDIRTQIIDVRTGRHIYAHAYTYTCGCTYARVPLLIYINIYAVRTHRYDNTTQNIICCF